MNAQLSQIIRKIVLFLRARPPAGGLEISDTALRFAGFSGGQWKFAAVRLPPGAVQNNKIIDQAAFDEGLQQLRLEILKKKSKRKISVVAVVSSMSVYSQAFTLPVIDSDNLEKAVALNLQMISPSEASELYSGWEVLPAQQRSDVIEIFSAFINKTISDELRAGLDKAGFLSVVLEYRALALARLMRVWGADVDAAKSYILAVLDTVGMDFVVMRRGSVYFEYFVPWSEVQGTERAISQEMFSNAFIRSLTQVVNFYSQHGNGTIDGAFLSSPTGYDTLEALIKEHFPFAVHEIRLTIDPPVAAQWYTALGSGLRGLGSLRKDTEISLLGIGAQEEFRHYQIFHFLDLWSVGFATAGAVLIVALTGSWLFLRSIAADLHVRLAAIPDTSQLAELDQLEKRALDFNQTVALIKQAQQLSSPKTDVMQKINGFATQSEVTINKFSFGGYGAASSITGEAKSYAQILAFKKLLSADGQFLNVNLPINQTSPSANGTSFSLNVTIASPAAGNT